MATHIGIGFSRDIDPQTAAKHASFESKSQLNRDTIDIAITFSTVHYKPELTVPVQQAILKGARLIGCSTAGIILSDSVEPQGIAVLTVTSDDIKFGIGAVENLEAQGPSLDGNILAQKTLADLGPQGRHAFLFFFDGYHGNHAVLLKGIQETFGNVFPILGAGSCDDFHFSETFQVCRDKILTRAATAMILGGQINVGIGCHHGWRPLGKPRIVDRAEGHIIRSIDGKKAFSIYEEYFGEQVEDLRLAQFGRMSILYPLGIFVEGSHEYLLRNVMRILPDGSIVCQGPVPEGSEVHIMIGNKESCLNAASQAAEDAHKDLLGKKAKLVIVFESMARLKLLGRTAHDEIKSIHEVFGPDIPMLGMYANGEVCPFQTVEKFKKPHLLNGSIVILAIA